MIVRSESAGPADESTGLLDINLQTLPPAQAARYLDLVPFDTFLTYVFAVLLNRAVDPVGRRHYRALAKAGTSRNGVVRDLLASGEFTRRYGSRQRAVQPVDDFINQTYQDVLGRWPDADGLATYRRIAGQWRGRGRVTANIIGSAEALRRGGGRMGRIASLQAYAGKARAFRLPLLGRWLRRRDAVRIRLDRIELGQQALRQELAALAERIEAGGAARHGGEAAIAPLDPSAAADPAAVDDWTYRSALRRARRLAMVGG